MPTFDEILIQSTARDSNIIPGCVFAAVDKTGKILYSGSSGYDSVLADAPPINAEGAFWIASCSKIVGTVAALQCVERGLFTLDEPVSKVLPELSEPQIIVPGNADSTSDQFQLVKATKQITLRQLLTHSSGLAYDIMDPVIMAWRSSRNEAPKTLTGTVIDAQTVPLKFEPGEGWAYGGGIDWAGLLVSRLNNNIRLEEYMEENIFKPLRLEATSFRLENHPEIKDKLVGTSTRQLDGTFVSSPNLWPLNAPDDCAGAGLYSTVEDFTKVIGDLVRDSPVLLKKETVQQLFMGQFDKGSSALNMFRGTPELSRLIGVNDIEKGANAALGGMYLQEQTETMQPGTLLWAGLPNLYWFANRDKGLAGFYASQVLPPADPASAKLAFAFFQEVFGLGPA
ncbi:beta-lactamase/transpeptidase-like protein [Aspergillus carlsbadensis]|nr:beta-lactamase/transpeptidase-like protein [Aspergillus carlsbadensis]